MPASLIALALVSAPMDLPPYVYERARREAVSVVVIEAERVEGLNGRTTGACTVSGRITAVERGPHQVGERLSLAVPCVGPAYQARPGPWPGYPEATMTGSTRGRAWLDAEDGLVRRGYDVLETEGD
jgi:hypothetical protein